jgi:hypothetical protein
MKKRIVNIELTGANGIEIVSKINVVRLTTFEESN